MEYNGQVTRREEKWESSVANWLIIRPQNTKVTILKASERPKNFIVAKIFNKGPNLHIQYR